MGFRLVLLPIAPGYRTAQVSASMGALSWKGTDIGVSSRIALREKRPHPLALGLKLRRGGAVNRHGFHLRPCRFSLTGDLSPHLPERAFR